MLLDFFNKYNKTGFSTEFINNSVKELNHLQKRAILNYLAGISFCDGRLDVNENSYFKRVSEHFNIEFNNVLYDKSVMDMKEAENIIKNFTDEQKDFFIELTSGMILCDGDITNSEMIYLDKILKELELNPDRIEVIMKESSFLSEWNK